MLHQWQAFHWLILLSSMRPNPSRGEGERLPDSCHSCTHRRSWPACRALHRSHRWHISRRTSHTVGLEQRNIKYWYYWYYNPPLLPQSLPIATPACFRQNIRSGWCLAIALVSRSKSAKCKECWLKIKNNWVVKCSNMFRPEKERLYSWNLPRLAGSCYKQQN